MRFDIRPVMKRRIRRPVEIIIEAIFGMRMYDAAHDLVRNHADALEPVGQHETGIDGDAHGPAQNKTFAPAASAHRGYL